MQGVEVACHHRLSGLTDEGRRAGKIVVHGEAWGTSYLWLSISQRVLLLRWRSMPTRRVLDPGRILQGGQLPS